MQNLLIVCPGCLAVNRIPAEKQTQHPKCGQCKKDLFTGKPISLNQHAFTKHVKRNQIPVVVDFWADWCAPCKAMAPAFAQVTKQLEPQVRMVKLDTEKQQDIAAKFAIRSIPTLIFFNKGNEIGRISGALSAAQLKQWIVESIKTLP